MSCLEGFLRPRARVKGYALRLGFSELWPRKEGEKTKTNRRNYIPCETGEVVTGRHGSDRAWEERNWRGHRHHGSDREGTVG